VNPKETRRRAGRSLDWVAAMSGVSAPSARLYEEAGPHAVGERVRTALARVYAELAELGSSPRKTGIAER
jgi:hypothetical protein